MESSGRSAAVVGLVAGGVAIASIVLMVLNGPSTGRVLVLVAMLILLLSRLLAVGMRRSGTGR